MNFLSRKVVPAFFFSFCEKNGILFLWITINLELIAHFFFVQISDFDLLLTSVRLKFSVKRLLFCIHGCYAQDSVSAQEEERQEARAGRRTGARSWLARVGFICQIWFSIA